MISLKELRRGWKCIVNYDQGYRFGRNSLELAGNRVNKLSFNFVLSIECNDVYQ